MTSTFAAPDRMARNTWNIAPRNAVTRASGAWAVERTHRSLDDLPRAAGRFIGRNTELRALHALLDSHAHVTVCGGPGMGKTHFLLAALESRRAAYERIVYANVAGLRDAFDFVPVVLARIGCRSVCDDTPASIVGALRGNSSVLLVIDGADRAHAPVVELAERVSNEPGIALAVTSREPLGSAGEQVMTLGSLSSDEALTFLIERAPVGVRDAHTTALLRRTCERFGNIPLALELAAAKLVAHATGCFDDAFARPPGPDDDRLCVGLSWSYAQLPAAEQRVLRALAVLAGAWSVRSAQDLCGPDAFAVLERLVAAGSVQRTAGTAESARYTLLDPLRTYVGERASEREREEVERRHVVGTARFIADAARGFARPERPIAELDAAVARALDERLEDVFAAVETAVRREMWGDGIEIVAGAYRYWPARGRASWAARTLGRLLAAAEAHGKNQAATLCAGWRALVYLNARAEDADVRSGLTAALRAQQLADGLDDDDERSRTNVAMMVAVEGVGDAERAIAHGVAALELAHARERHYDQAAILYHLAGAYDGLDRRSDAAAAWQRAARTFEALGERPGRMRAMARLAESTARAGETAKARRILRRTLRIARCEAGSALAAVLCRLAATETLLGHPLRARSLAAAGIGALPALERADDVAPVCETLAASLIEWAPAAAAAALTFARARRCRAALHAYPVDAARTEVLWTRLHATLPASALSALEAEVAGDGLDDLVARLTVVLPLPT